MNKKKYSNVNGLIDYFLSLWKSEFVNFGHLSFVFGVNRPRISVAKSGRAHRPVNWILHLDADYYQATCLAPPRVSAKHSTVEESYIKEDFWYFLS